MSGAGGVIPGTAPWQLLGSSGGAERSALKNYAALAFLGVRLGADAELVALGIGHDHVVVVRVEVVPDEPGAEAG